MTSEDAPSTEPRRDRRRATPAIELRHLRYFIAVFEELHFGHAAERLHISQPPLSQAIRRLEDELGVALLERTSRVVTPTDAGRVFAEEARAVLATVDAAVAEARRAGGADVAIRIGCVSDLPIRRLLRFLVALKRREPARVVTNLYVREEVVRHLRRGELDLGIFPDAGDHDEIATEPLAPSEPMVALVSPEHPLAASDVPLGPGTLDDEVLLVLPRAADPLIHDRQLASIESFGYRFNAIQEVAGTNARDLLLAVAQNAGVALAPKTFAEITEGDIVAHRTLEPAPVMPPLVVGWPLNHRPWLDPIMRAAREVARELRTLSHAQTTSEGERREAGEPAFGSGPSVETATGEVA
jgi:DNA-binding transcriptional LysR family regulator